MNSIERISPAGPIQVAPAPDAMPPGPIVAGNQLVPGPSLIEILWRRRWTVLLAVVVSVVAAFVYLLTATPIYTSTSRLYVERQAPRLLGNDPSGNSSTNYLATQVEILRSGLILNAAANNLTRLHLRTFEGTDSIVAFLKNKVDVAVGKKDDLISVSIDSPYSEDAAQIVNTIVDAYITQFSQQNRSTVGELLKILQKERSKDQAELDDKLNQLAEFRKQHSDLFFETDRSNLVLERLRTLSDELTQAQLATIQVKSFVNAIDNAGTNRALIEQLTLAQMSGNFNGQAFGMLNLVLSEESRLRDSRNTIATSLVVLQQQFPSDRPNVRETQAALDAIDAQLREANKQIIDMYKQNAHEQFTLTEAREAEIAKAYHEQEQKAVALNENSAGVVLLNQNIDRLQRLTETLDDRIMEVGVREDTGALNINIVEVAHADSKPSKPQKTRTLGIALVLGLMLGCGMALLLFWTDHRLRSAEEIELALGLPVLGVVPHIEGRKHISIAGQTVRLFPMSDVAEAYRTVRTALAFGMPDRVIKSVVVTSPGAGDGKSTSASNLAIALASAGQRVLLVDADFRKPSIHRIFELPSTMGISSVLAGQKTLEEVIHASRTPGLDVLPCGEIPANPAELLNGEQFASILKTLGDKYDMLVIDSPPVAPVTDARILGARCDLTLLVLRAEKSTRAGSEHARNSLLSVGATIPGILVNDVPRNRNGYGYYAGYGGYSSYGKYGHTYGGHSSRADGASVAVTVTRN